MEAAQNDIILALLPVLFPLPASLVYLSFFPLLAFRVISPDPSHSLATTPTRSNGCETDSGSGKDALQRDIGGIRCDNRSALPPTQ